MAKVTLIAYAPSPEKTVAAAAKLCYSPVSIDEIRDGLTIEKTNAFVDMLTELGHESPIEHASFTFGIEGVSRSFLAQITRHRIASYSVQSQRYVRERCLNTSSRRRSPTPRKPEKRFSAPCRRIRSIMTVCPACSRKAQGGLPGAGQATKNRRPPGGEKKPLRTPALFCPMPARPR